MQVVVVVRQLLHDARRPVQPERRALCLAVAGEFLDRKRVSALKAKDVTRFVDACAGRPGLSGALSALRSVLRFLFSTSRTTLSRAR